MTDPRDEHETYGHTHSPVIEDLRKQVATLLDEQAGFRVAIAQLTAERDEAMRDAERWQADAMRLLNERNAAQAERDEARRALCRVESASRTVLVEEWMRTNVRAICKWVATEPDQIASERGWDCFKESDK
jgi:chromosome segregation ATPase